MTWKEFRNLTKDIPEDEDVYFECYNGGHSVLSIDLTSTLANFTNDNTIILEMR